jgi:hypothetical protein
LCIHPLPLNYPSQTNVSDITRYTRSS